MIKHFGCFHLTVLERKKTATFHVRYVWFSFNCFCFHHLCLHKFNRTISLIINIIFIYNLLLALLMCC